MPERGLHRVRGETTRPVERSHAPVKDRLRAMRGLGSVSTGQRVLEAVEGAQAVRRGDLRRGSGCACTSTVVSAGNRARSHTFAFLFAAEHLRLPGSPPASRWRPEAVES